MITLEPLAKTPLSSQLRALTGHSYSSIEFDRVNDTVIHKSTGKRFKMASMEIEEQYKEEQKKIEELKQSNLKVKYLDKKEPFIYLHNHTQWREGLKALKNGGMVEMCIDAYYHFFECVPPKAFGLNSFVCGEPYDHNNKGEGIYLCGIKKEGKYFAQYGTIKQYTNKELFK